MAKLSVDLKPFNTPNFVVPLIANGKREDGYSSTPGIPLLEVDADTLSELCDDFRAEVFQKANKEDPKMEPPF